MKENDNRNCSFKYTAHIHVDLQGYQTTGFPMTELQRFLTEQKEGFPLQGQEGAGTESRDTESVHPSLMLCCCRRYIIPNISRRAPEFPPDLRLAHCGTSNRISGGGERQTHPAKCWLQRNPGGRTEKASPRLTGIFTINKPELGREKRCPLIVLCAAIRMQKSNVAFHFRGFLIPSLQ